MNIRIMIIYVEPEFVKLLQMKSIIFVSFFRKSVCIRISMGFYRKTKKRNEFKMIFCS